MKRSYAFTLTLNIAFYLHLAIILKFLRIYYIIYKNGLCMFYFQMCKIHTLLKKIYNRMYCKLQTKQFNGQLF